MRKLLLTSISATVVSAVVLLLVSNAEARGRRSCCNCAPAPAAACCSATPMAAVPPPGPAVAQAQPGQDVRRSFSYEPSPESTNAAVQSFSSYNYAAPRSVPAAFLPKSNPNKYNGTP